MKAVVTRDGRDTGGTLVLNDEFQRFAAHWGFRIRACRPYRAQTKGKVERQIRMSFELNLRLFDVHVWTNCTKTRSLRVSFS